MSLHWFRVSRAADDETLRAMGIEIRPRIRQCLYRWDEETNSPLVEVGEITVYQSGRIYIWPRKDATARHLDQLRAAAEIAFRETPKRATGWHYRRRGKAGRSYWWSALLVPASPDDPMVLAMRASRGTEESNRPALMESDRMSVGADTVHGHDR